MAISYSTALAHLRTLAEEELTATGIRHFLQFEGIRLPLGLERLVDGSGESMLLYVVGDGPHAAPLDTPPQRQIDLGGGAQIVEVEGQLQYRMPLSRIDSTAAFDKDVTKFLTYLRTQS